MPLTERFPWLRQRALVGALAALGVVLSITTYTISRRSEDREINMEFLRRADVRSVHTRERIALFEGGLFGLSHLLTASENITRADFAFAAEAMRGRYQGISALEWVGVVPDANRKQVESQVSAELGRKFEFLAPHTDNVSVRAPFAEIHYPILYVEPMAGNERAFGYDLVFGPTATDLANAREHRQLTVTRCFRLIQETADQSSVVFIWPVFEPTGDQSKLLGFVQGVFRLHDILAGPLRDTDGNALDILWIDPREQSPEYRVLLRDPATAGAALLNENDFRDNTVHSINIPVGNRHWVALYRPNPAWLKSQRTSTPIWLLLLGLSVTGLLSCLIVVLQRQKKSIERKVVERTSQLVESRKLLEGLMQSLPGMAYRSTHEQPPRVFYVSDGAKKLTGYSAAEILSGEISPRQYIHSEDRERISQTVDQALKKRSTFECEYRIITRDGLTKWVLLRGHGIYDQDGQIQYSEGLVIDITERKQTEENSLQLERRLFEGQKLESLGLLAGGIAHDFNNLLTSILGNAGLARMDLPEESPIKNNLKEIERASQKAADLCQQMLSFAGQGRLTVEPVKLDELIVSLQPLLSASANRNIQLEYQLDPTPASTGDIAQIRQVILNLVINAVEAIGSEAGIISLSTGVETIDPSRYQSDHPFRNIEPGRYAFMKVADTGGGIPPDSIDRIFDPFFTTKFAGRGLGLAAVRGIVYGHNGTVFVQSEPQQGSTFTVLLPLPVEPTASSTEDSSVKRIVALVVDDDESVLGVTTELLRSFDYEAVAAQGGEKALAVFLKDTSRFDLVLLDIIMPGMNGLDTLARLRALRPSLPVLMMSGQQESEPVEALAAQGPLAFITKPFTRATLQTALRNLLES